MKNPAIRSMISTFSLESLSQVKKTWFKLYEDILMKSNNIVTRTSIFEARGKNLQWYQENRTLSHNNRTMGG